MSENAGGSLSEYFSLIRDMIPLVLITASLTFTIGLHYVKRSYLQRTFWQTIGNLLFSAAIAAMLAVCGICLSELFFPAISAKMELGIAVFVGLFGTKGIDIVLRRKFNLAVVDLMKPEEATLLAEEAEKKKKGKRAQKKRAGKSEK